MQGIPDRRQVIDDIVKTKDIFINDDLFSDTDTRDICNLVDQIKSETDVNDVLLEMNQLTLHQIFRRRLSHC